MTSALPNRPWVTLTEAATLVAYGFSENAEAFAQREYELHESHREEVGRRARDAAPNKLVPPKDVPPELYGFIEERAAERQEFREKFQAALKRLILAGAEGRVQFSGHLEGRGRRENLGAGDFQDVMPWPGNELDMLAMRTGSAWRNVSVERDSLEHWVSNADSVAFENGQETTKTPTRPSDGKVEQWFTIRKDKFLGSARWPSLEEDWKDAQAELPGARREQVRMARDKVAPEWNGKTGPRGPRS